MEHIDLFILYSQYHGCWWSGDASSHGLMKPEYSSTPAADAVAPCITRPSAPVILTMQDKEVIVIESFTWGTTTCLSCIYSQYLVCWWPGDKRSHGILKTEFSRILAPMPLLLLMYWARCPGVFWFLGFLSFVVVSQISFLGRSLTCQIKMNVTLKI